MNDRLIIYGMPPSQPARVLFWACLLKGLPFEARTTRTSLFNTDGTNPRGQVPAIVDGDFCLSEMAAIICYLARKHDWFDLYPSDLEIRARIDEFLHRYHTLFRMATLKLMGPFVAKPLKLPALIHNPYGVAIRDLLSISFSAEDPLKEGGEAVEAIADFLEKYCFKDDVPYVCGTQTPTIADLVCYSELGQLKLSNLFDFTEFPKTSCWLESMTKVPYHDTIHAFNFELGDLTKTPCTPERFRSAMDIGFKAMEKTGLVTLLVKD